MSHEPSLSLPHEPAPRILVVDDDHRVVELLTLALAGQGFQVITAANGDDAMQQTLTHRPDLIVLDVRLPKRSGLEVCELIRRDRELASTPIVLVSAAGETDARVQGFARGADDYLLKPFSPKELVARIQRLIARSQDQRDTRRRLREAERELQKGREAARRAHLDMRREQRLRELASGPGRDLVLALDAGEVARRLLDLARVRSGCTVGVLFVPDGDVTRFTPLAVGGESFARFAGEHLASDGELATLLGGLGRPVLRRDLERFPGMEAEMPVLVRMGAMRLAPLAGPEGLEGLLVTDERSPGAGDPADLETLGALCDAAALALYNARRVRAQIEPALVMLAQRAALDAADDAAPSAALASRAARALGADPFTRAALGHAVALGRWGMGPEGMLALTTLERGDLAGVARAVRAVLARAERLPEPLTLVDPAEECAAVLARVAIEWREACAAGLDREAALESACASLGEALDPLERRALREALVATREVVGSGRAA